jgi:hypothetical protein
VTLGVDMRVNLGIHRGYALIRATDLTPCKFERMVKAVGHSHAYVLEGGYEIHCLVNVMVTVDVNDDMCRHSIERMITAYDLFLMACVVLSLIAYGVRTRVVTERAQDKSVKR